VTVANGALTTAPYSVPVNATQPSMLTLPPLFDANSAYLAALFPDFATYAIPPFPAYSHVPSSRPKPGDTVVFFGMGFDALSKDVQFGFSRATPVVYGRILYAGPAPGALGLFQFNVIVPDVPLFAGETSNDFIQVSVLVNGRPIPTPPSLLFSIQK
jgi:uncharacterized protein (TIGR03437 family)